MVRSPVGELGWTPCGLERGAEAASAQAGSWGLSLSHHLIFILPPLVSPLLFTHKGPGQQGWKAKADGDHLRLWGVRVRGTFSALPLRIQEQSVGEPARKDVPFSRGLCPGPSQGQLGAAPLQAWPEFVWLFPKRDCGPGSQRRRQAALPAVDGCAWLLRRCCRGVPWAHQCVFWTFLLTKQTLVLVLLPASQAPGVFGGCSYDWAIPLGQTGAPILLLLFPAGCP